MYVCSAPVKENVVNVEPANEVVQGLDKVIVAEEFVVVAEYVPGAQVVHTRSVVEVAAVE